jgi:hypothetical protein
MLGSATRLGAVAEVSESEQQTENTNEKEHQQ